MQNGKHTVTELGFTGYQDNICFNIAEHDRPVTKTRLK